MTIRLGTVLVLVLSPLSLSAACKPGYRTGTVLKVVDLDLSSAASARAKKAGGGGQSPERNNAASARVATFRAGGERYELQFPPGAASSAFTLSAGQEVCFRKEGNEIRVLTDDGKPLPGAARPVPRVPRR